MVSGSPYQKRLPRPTRNFPYRSTPLRNRARDYKSQLRLVHRRELQTPPCSSRSRDIHSISGRPPQLFAEFPLARAIRFDNANEKDAAVHTAWYVHGAGRLSSSGSTFLISLPP